MTTSILLRHEKEGWGAGHCDFLSVGGGGGGQVLQIWAAFNPPLHFINAAFEW